MDAKDEGSKALTEQRKAERDKLSDMKRVRRQGGNSASEKVNKEDGEKLGGPHEGKVT